MNIRKYHKVQEAWAGLLYILLFRVGHLWALYKFDHFSSTDGLYPPIRVYSLLLWLCVLLRSKTSSVLMRSAGRVRGSWVSGSSWRWSDKALNMKNTRIACERRVETSFKCIHPANYSQLKFILVICLFFISLLHMCVCSHTLRVFSTSPQGSLFTKSMPVRGVPVGGSRMEASIMRYSTFRGLLCNKTHQELTPGAVFIALTAHKYVPA